MIVNLHGLGSIGENTAYTKLRKMFGDDVEIISPTYCVYNFEKGVRDIELAVKDFSDETLVFVGSSTGALFAEYFAEEYNGQVILINPVSNIKQIYGRLGKNRNHYTGEEYEITQKDFDTFPPPVINEIKDIPRLIFYEADDDVLNHNSTYDKYRNNGTLVPFDGQSHRFEHWEEALPRIYNFYNRIYM